MAQRQGQTTEERIGEVCGRIEHWRQTRLKRSPMPEALWDAAAAIAREAGVYRVMRALGVNYETLKRRVEEQGACRKASAGAFVELAPASLVGPGADGCVVEVQERDGTRLRVQLAGGDRLDVVALVAAFRRRP
jgi:hypothetical protein